MVAVNPHIGPDESGHTPIVPGWVDLCTDQDAMNAELDSADSIPRSHPALMHIPPSSGYLSDLSRKLDRDLGWNLDSAPR